MTFWRMPLLVWANLATSTLVVLATPFIAGAQFMVLFDRLFPTHFFDPAAGGNLIMYQHIFWFYSHPAVYIMMLPGFGIISEVIAMHSRKPIFGYRLIALSTVAIGVLGFTVWAHHMFIAGMAPWLRVPMMFTTMLIAVPTGIKIFSWLATHVEGRDAAHHRDAVRLRVPVHVRHRRAVRRLPGGAARRHQRVELVLRGRPHPLRAVRRVGVHHLRRHLPLVSRR